MDTTTFLRSVVGSAGYYCVWAIKDGRKDTIKQKFYSDIAAMEHAAKNLDQNGYDAYFALGTFKTGRIREAYDVQEMRSFFLDLDCGLHLKTGLEKDYPDQAAALSALREFCEDNGFPEPITVSSGYGVHAYWPLTTPVSRERWLPVAIKLKALASRQGFKTDTARTADAASVLRVPGTFNHKKQGVPVPVEIITDGPEPGAYDFELFEALLMNVRVPEAVPPSVKDDTQRDPLLDALLNTREHSFKTILCKTAAGAGCAQLAHIISNRATLSEPLWRAGLSIAKHCTDAAKAAKAMSMDHPDYDEGETLDKMSRIVGPYTCAKFDECNPGLCQDCGLWGKIKSPIVLGSHFKEAAPEDNIIEDTTNGETITYEIPKYPEPYFRGVGGGVFLRGGDETGNEDRMVYLYDLYVVSRLSDPETGENLVMRLHLPKDGVREFTVPLAVATSREEFRKVLSANGVAAINKEVDYIMSYTQAWVNTLQADTRASDARRQFGWTTDKFESFALGDQLIFPDRIEYNAPSTSTRSMFSALVSKGSLNEWRRTMEFYNRPGFELHQLVVCAGLGSVLMPFTNISSCVINLYSKDTGFGKTTAQYAALSHWGVPKTLIMSENDTHNSRMNRMEVMRNLPVCIDEITNIKPMDASDMIYNISGARQRNRLASSGNTERHRGDPWSFICITSSNCSIIDKISLAKAMPRAEAQRMLEIEVSRKFKAAVGKSETDAFTADIHSSYGHSGVIFVQYVMNNLEQVRTLVTQVQRNIDAEAKLGPENRFWSAGIAAAISALLIARKLKLLRYDAKALSDYAIHDVLTRNKSGASLLESSAEDLVTEYIYENWGRVLQIKSTISRQGAHLRNNNNGLDEFIQPDQMPRGDIIARYEPDTKRLFLVPKPFREWLSEQQMDYKSVRSELVSMCGAYTTKVRITRGTMVNLPAIDALTIKMDIQNEKEEPKATG